jgi:zeta-carotene desaturase
VTTLSPKALCQIEYPDNIQGAPKLKVAIVGGGLAGLSTAVELLDQGYEVDIYEQRPFIGGKVASYKDRSGNHVEMGLHVFFGWGPAARAAGVGSLACCLREMPSNLMLSLRNV